MREVWVRARRKGKRECFDSRIAARLTRMNHAVVLGDSHAEVLANWRTPGWWFDVTRVGGATASGIRNPNSATEALPRFRARLARARPWQPILLLLGEVDCGYTIWLRAAERGITEGECLEEALRRFEAFVNSEIANSHPIYVMSVPLPTLPDGATGWGEVALRRSDITATQAQRTDLTLMFNESMAEICARRGWTFVDSTKVQIDPLTGLIHSDFVRTGKSDHHLSDEPYRRAIAAALALCRRARGLPPAVSQDGHPNPEAHTEWSLRVDERTSQADVL